MRGAGSNLVIARVWAGGQSMGRGAGSHRMNHCNFKIAACKGAKKQPKIKTLVVMSSTNARTYVRQNLYQLLTLSKFSLKTIFLLIGQPHAPLAAHVPKPCDSKCLGPPHAMGRRPTNTLPTCPNRLNHAIFRLPQLKNERNQQWDHLN